MPIQVLPDEIAIKIAAGEVVERPASVVKELIENAIDAGARAIRVEIEGGGKRLIKITDDGCGIPTDELPLAFARHATSKLTTIADLFHIQTLGFRGEALASVAAISRLTFITRPKEQVGGTLIRIEGGVQQSLGPMGAPVGTSVTVENLFFNVPARLKFLKADATETGHIHRVVSHYAMAFPGIRFSLKSNGRQTFQTDGSGKLFDVLVTLWGLETAKQLVPVSGQTESGLTVEGFVGNPGLHRGRRDQIIFFINRRWIQDRALAQAVVQAYHTFLQVGRNPVAVLNIQIDPADVDVNVHPTKAEVKFKDPRAVFSAVQRPVRQAVLQESPLVRPAQSWAEGSGGDPAWSPGGTGGSAMGGWAGHGASPQASQFGLEIQRPLPTESPFDAFQQPATDDTHLPPLRVVGQIQQMYVIAEGPDGLYLVDQHAAHERILYEQMMAQQAQAAVASQRLLTPALLELSPAQAALIEAELDTLRTVGFELEPFGGQSYRLLALPQIFGQTDPVAAFLGVLEDMLDGAVPMARQTHEKIAIIVCKRASIKGGQTLSQNEMNELIHSLEACQNPRTCPHGRPTMLHMSAYQLAREFGRH